jgi:hypothetical protein
MNWTQLVIQLASQLGTAIVERFARSIGEPKQEVPDLDVNSIATATKSAVSADREGKIASERGKVQTFKVGDRVRVKWPWMDSSWNGVVLVEEDGNYKVHAENGYASWSCRPSEMTLLGSVRRLGDYGPGGE